MRKLFLIISTLLISATIAQDLNIGAKLSLSTISTDFTPRDFDFSTSNNEISHLRAIRQNSVAPTLIGHIDYKFKNRIRLYGDITVLNTSYQIQSEYNLVDEYDQLEDPEFSTFHLVSTLGTRVIITQRKLIVPYLTIGVSYNGLLGINEKKSDEYGSTFSKSPGREVRNGYMYDYLTQFSSQYFSVNAGVGFLLYNFFLEFHYDQNITAIDDIDTYQNQQRFQFVFGVNLLRFQLSKKQKYED